MSKEESLAKLRRKHYFVHTRAMRSYTDYEETMKEADAIYADIKKIETKEDELKKEQSNEL